MFFKFNFKLFKTTIPMEDLKKNQKHLHEIRETFKFILFGCFVDKNLL